MSATQAERTVSPRRQTQTLERLLLTPEEAAEVLGITRSTVYELMRLQLLRSVKIGKKYRRIPMDACRELVDASRRRRRRMTAAQEESQRRGQHLPSQRRSMGRRGLCAYQPRWAQARQLLREDARRSQGEAHRAPPGRRPRPHDRRRELDRGTVSDPLARNGGEGNRAPKTYQGYSSLSVDTSSRMSVVGG